MSHKEDELDLAQKKQDNVGEVASNPETSGLAENVREKGSKDDRIKARIQKNLPNEITSVYSHPLFL